MSGVKLRILGASALTLGLVGLLSGWSVLDSADGTPFAVLQLGLVGAGLLLVYRGERRSRRRQRPPRHR